jgi:hypothetical protein
VIVGIAFSYRFANWARSAVTIPSALTMKDHYSGPIVGNQTYLQTTGTTTNATVAVAEMELTLDLGLEPIYGGTLAGEYQQIGGWARSGCKPTCTMRIPWASAYETLFNTSNASYTHRHILWSSNTLDGRRVGFYMPRAFLVGNSPSQPTAVNNQNYVALTWVGTESTVTTSELTKSPVRLFSS